MLKKFDLKFEGREHAGIDDARNIARILIQLAKRGAPLDINKEA
jgi:inhibitor of KinA sporulation pathway (predicted exonuclease)